MQIATIHVNPTADLSALSPIRRILFLLWLGSLRDRATSLRHTYEPGVSKLSYKVDDQWHELIPIPEHLAPLVGEEVRNWLNRSRFHRLLADQLRRLADHFDPSERETIIYQFMLVIDPAWSLCKVAIQERNGRGEVNFDFECTNWTYDQVSRIQFATTTRDSGIDLGTGVN